MPSPGLRPRRASIGSMRRVSGRLDTHTPTLEKSDLVHDSLRANELAVHQERLRLARELHDSVAQSLFGITLGAARVLALLERQETEQVRTVVSELLRLADEAQTELRS